jgi:valyl-tRNA synthetase
MESLIRDAERLFQNFQYGEAGRQIYEFFWSDFADWYLEIAKGQLTKAETKYSTALNLARIFDLSLKMLHPFTPFVTEELWGHLRSAMLESPLADFAKEWTDALIVSRWPEPGEPDGWEESKVADFTQIQDVVRSIRNARAEKNIKPSKKIAAILVDKDKADLYRTYLPMISTLSSTDSERTFVYDSEYKLPDAVASLVVGSTNIYLSDLESSKEDKARLERELSEAESHIERLEKLLASDFAGKAPAPVVAREREKLAAFRETAEKLKAQLG